MQEEKILSWFWGYPHSVALEHISLSKTKHLRFSSVYAEYLQDRGFCQNENFELHAVQYNTEITKVSVCVPHPLTQFHEKSNLLGYISLDSRPMIFALVYAESVFVLELLNYTQEFLKFLSLMLLAISHSEWKNKLINKTEPQNDQTSQNLKRPFSLP